MRLVRLFGAIVIAYLMVCYLLDAFGLYDVGFGPR